MKWLPDILFEDAELVVINKPPKLLSIQDRHDPAIPHALGVLRERYGDLFVVHRLDRETSGVMVFARSAAAHRMLNRLFEERRVIKTYLALVEGMPSPRTGRVDRPIAPNPSRPGTVRIDVQFGRPAATVYRTVETFASYSLIEALPETGRTHQIRIHFASIGHPLAVDDVYGNNSALYLSRIKPGYRPKAGREERPLMDRATLHAYSLEWTAANSSERQCFTAPLPKDFRALLHQLQKYGR